MFNLKQKILNLQLTFMYELNYYKPVILAKYCIKDVLPLPTGPTKQATFPVEIASDKFFKFCFVEFTSMRLLSYKIHN